MRQREIIGYNNKSANGRGNFKDVVLEEMLKIFSKKLHIQLIKLPSKKRIDKLAVSSTLDSEAYEITDILINNNYGELKKIKPIVKIKWRIIIKPLYLFLNEEIFLYAKLRKLKFKNIEKDKNKLRRFINELEQKHPEIKRAIVNSFLKLYI
ncbi:MAG: hypothetical protein AABX30_00155 [Nanoarchaeota archaeon]